MSRSASLERNTQETAIVCRIALDGPCQASVRTGIGFLDHMLCALGMHAGMCLELRCEGDLEVDDHHTVEDCAIVLGGAIDRALGVRSGIARFGHAYAPMDEALVRCAIDLSGRPHAEVHLGLRRERLGRLACENIPHFFRSLAFALRASVHLDTIRGENDHHIAEGAFKALALALRRALAVEPGAQHIPSTKGVL